MPSFPIIPSASSISFFQFQTKNNAIGKEATNKSNSINQNSTVSVNKRRHSKSYLERQSAILQLSSSSSQSHFDSALARLGGMLKVQDLNAVWRNFGTLSRWQDLSQLFE